MKIEVLQENLVKALSIATRIVSSKPQLPVLSHILVVVTGEGCKIIASNIETGIIVPFGAKVENTGEILIPGRTFYELISSLSSGKLILEQKDSSILISESKFHGKVVCLPSSEFPKLEPPKNKFSTFPKKDFKEALSKTVFSSATDEGRAVLNGILFKLTEPKSFVSTDGFRLSKFDFSNIDLKISGIDQAIVPTKTVIEILRLLDELQSDSLGIGFENNQFIFQIGEIFIFSQIIAGNYPEYEKIIPSESEIKIRIDAKELEKAIKTASIFARENANIVRFSLENKILKVKAQGGQTGENETEIDVEVIKNSSAEFTVSFNYRYVLDFLNNLGNEKEVFIEFGTPTSPSIFRPADKNGYLHIIMPVRVQY